MLTILLAPPHQLKAEFFEKTPGHLVRIQALKLLEGLHAGRPATVSPAAVSPVTRSYWSVVC